ncbi:hypothetical protein PVAND_010581 [Polypedilum vanderplanki]|uniref:Tetratricopeptide repeat protein n=1 Tax=Polypedilum vanderplanki TaxID=319348 RepID=A0A9J6CG07_POLVA|nr:hypothetical protein PVAND_010581 [Polypedilum vanderplanki]
MSNEKDHISARDLSILNLIFDQKNCEEKINECIETVVDTIDIKDCDEENSEEIKESKRLEIEGVILTESAKFDEALIKFNQSIDLAPQRPSPYNNRAQLFRFLDEDEKAIIDLNKSIELSSDEYMLTKCRAYTQRGIIKRKQNNIEEARDDFNESAKLGSKFAHQQLVDLNPYAQLCNQMVSKILNDYNEVK